MACEFVDLDASSAAACEFVEGGIIYSYVVDEESVESVTVASGVVTNFTMADPSLWKRWDYTDDGTALYEQPGTRNGDQITFAQRAFMKFNGQSAAYIDAGNKVLKCCATIAIHITSAGLRLVQGIEIQAGSTKGYVKTKVLGTRVVPSATTGTTQEAANMTFSLEGTSRSMSVSTSLSDAAIEAL